MIEAAMRNPESGLLTWNGLPVGQVRRIDGDGDQAEEWKAWLWPVPGRWPAMDTHCDGVARKGGLAKLMAAANKRWPEARLEAALPAGQLTLF